MARAPNFNFERQERERQKARKAAEKVDAKRSARAALQSSPPNPADGTEPSE